MADILVSLFCDTLVEDKGQYVVYCVTNPSEVVVIVVKTDLLELVSSPKLTDAETSVSGHQVVYSDTTPLEVIVTTVKTDDESGVC